jgi:hypothetical protein
MSANNARVFSLSLLERLNSPIAVAVVLVLFLSLDGFLFYRYQQAWQSTADEAANAPVEEAPPSLEEESTAAEETTPSPEEEQAQNAPAQNAPAQDVAVPAQDVAVPAQDVPVPAEDVPIEDVPAELPS